MADILKRANKSSRIRCTEGEVVVGAAVVARHHEESAARHGGIGVAAWLAGGLGIVIAGVEQIFRLATRRRERVSAQLGQELKFGQSFLVLTDQRLLAFRLGRWSEAPRELVSEWPIGFVAAIEASDRGLRVCLHDGVDYRLECDRHHGRDQIIDAYRALRLG